MKTQIPGRFWWQLLPALASSTALVLTLIEPDWIEQVFSIEPDGGDGSAEWGLSLALLIATCTFIALAGRTWRVHTARI